MDRRTLLKAGLVTPAAVAATGLLPAPAEAAPQVGATLAQGLNYPWGADFLPDHSALVSLRNSGDVIHVQPTGGYTTVGTIPGIFNNGGEGGLLGLALSPTFATDGWVYLYRTTTQDNQVIRVRYDGSILLGTLEVLLPGLPRNQTHNGGGLWFTDHPSLYVTCGDTRRPKLAQHRGNFYGKILRLKPDGTAQDRNPFGTRVYSYGHRNPEGITKARDGTIWSSELGENTWDELNRIRRGVNYGWPKVEGPDGPGGFPDPFAKWHPAECSPSGIAILDDRAWIGALRGESLWSVELTGAHAHRRTRHFNGQLGRIRMVKRAPDGSLWIGTSNGGGNDRIVRVTL